MSRTEDYNALIKRIELPENHERYAKCVLHPNKENGDYLLQFHLHMIRECLEILNERNDEFIANSCDASIKSAEQLLDHQGWKNQKDAE